MKQFTFYNPTTLADAVGLLGDAPEQAQVLAGGMDLLSRLKKRIDTPARIVNLKSIPELNAIRETQEGLSLGALVTLTDLAESKTLLSRFRAVAEAAHSVGSVQIRNAGTVGGNLCQRPRCWYFRHPNFLCLQKGGAMCYAQAGESRYHAILGGGPCFFAHPSDLAPALIAFDATVRIIGPKGERTVPLEKLYHLPSEGLNAGLSLNPGEILAEVRIPVPPEDTRSTYVKFKEKPSFDFSLVGVAAALTFQQNRVKQASLALSGVAPAPWRAAKAEKLLEGAGLTEPLVRKVADQVVEDNLPLADRLNKARRTIARVSGIL